MRYFIGCNIRAEAAEYYKATCAELAARFGVSDISEIVHPHISVKYPFERGSIETIDNLISLSTEARAHPLTLSGWGHFGNRTIFIDVPAPAPEIKRFMGEIQTKLHQQAGIPVTPQEETAHLHLSIARFLKGTQFDDIWKYLQSMPAPKFDIHFDNLTIFKKENRDDRSWKVLKTFPLTGRK